MTLHDKITSGFDGDFPMRLKLPQWDLAIKKEREKVIRELVSEGKEERDLAPSLCVIVPPPLYSPGSWLKDRQGYGLFFPLHLLIIPSFCV